MPVPVGFQPERIRSLMAHTSTAIVGLASIDGSDPACATLHHLIRLTRRNLEEHWMPLLCDIVSNDAMTTWTPASALQGLRDEWTSTAAWLTIQQNETSAWSDRRLIDAVIAHDIAWPSAADGAFVDPTERHDDLFVDAMREIARRAALDPRFAELLLRDAGHTSTLGLMVTRAPFGPSFSAAVGERLLGPQATSGLLPDERMRHAVVTGEVLEHLSRWPALALEMLGDPNVRAGLVWQADLAVDSVREFVASGLHLAVLSDHDELQRSLDALAGFVPLAHEAPFSPGLAQGIASAVGTHMSHLGPLLDADTDAFLDVDGRGTMDADGRQITSADLASLYGRVVHDPDAQVLLTVGLTDQLEALLDAVPAAVDKASTSASPPPMGDVIRARIEPAVKAITFVFGTAAAVEQDRIDALHAERQRARREAVGVGMTLIGMAPGGKPVTRVLSTARRLLPPAQPPDAVADGDVLVDLDGVVAREALRLVVSDPDLRASAGLDVVEESTWNRLVTAADDPSIDFSNRGTLMLQLELDDIDAVLVDTFFAMATGTVDATNG